MDYLIDEQFEPFPRTIVKSLNGHDEWLALQASKCEAHVEFYRMSGNATKRHNENWQALLKERENGTEK